MIKQLVGWQLVSMDNDGFIVSKDGKQRTFEFVKDEGDCCGYNNFVAKLLYEDGSIDNPVITSVEFDNISSYYNEHVLVTFFGVDKRLALIDSTSSSGSGYCYGAYVKCRCVETSEEEFITIY